jgi:hypothetical protein
MARVFINQCECGAPIRIDSERCRSCESRRRRFFENHDRPAAVVHVCAEPYCGRVIGRDEVDCGRHRGRIANLRPSFP